MESNKIRRTTSREQFRCLVSKMKEHPDIANNFTKNAPDVVERFWESVREELNSLSKSIAEWKKVWSDYKSAVKKKLVHKRELQATGGGENREMSLSSLEEGVAALVCFNDCIGGINNTKQFGVPQKRWYDGNTPSTPRDVQQNTSSTSRNVQQKRIRECISPSTSGNDDGIEARDDGDMENDPNIGNQIKKRKKSPEHFDLLEKQVGVQGSIFT